MSITDTILSVFRAIFPKSPVKIARFQKGDTVMFRAKAGKSVTGTVLKYDEERGAMGVHVTHWDNADPALNVGRQLLLLDNGPEWKTIVNLSR